MALLGSLLSLSALNFIYLLFRKVNVEKSISAHLQDHFDLLFGVCTRWGQRFGFFDFWFNWLPDVAAGPPNRILEPGFLLLEGQFLSRNRGQDQFLRFFISLTNIFTRLIV
jgi:hypothetical protein